VYVADDKQTGQKVAVKEMILDQQPNKEIIVNEILLMKACTHRAIVSFIDSFLVEGALWVVMEFVDGCDLTQAIESCSPMEEAHIATIMREVLSALEHLHVQDIIHRYVQHPSTLWCLHCLRACLESTDLTAYACVCMCVRAHFGCYLSSDIKSDNVMLARDGRVKLSM
jgi:serine/threonine protein kinase